MMNMGVQMEWARTVNNYMEKYEITQIMSVGRQDIRSKIEQIAAVKWREEVEAKQTLTVYRLKDRICEESFYDNTVASSLMFKCRTNSLRLGWRNRFSGGSVECGMCGEGEETLEHFLIECRQLQLVRDRFGSGERLELGKILLFDRVTKEEIVQYKRLVLELWRERGRLMVLVQDEIG